MNAEEIESKSSANPDDSTTNTAVSQALSAASAKNRAHHRRRGAVEREKEHQKIQWSDNDDRLI